MIRAAGDVIGGQRPVVTYWMQGETDATDPMKAQAYEANLRDLFAHMRSDWGSDLISMGRIADSTPYFETVRWAQYVVDRDDPHVTSFDTYTFTRQPDGIHYDAAGQLALGHDMYSGWVLP